MSKITITVHPCALILALGCVGFVVLLGIAYGGVLGLGAALSAVVISSAFWVYAFWGGWK